MEDDIVLDEVPVDDDDNPFFEINGMTGRRLSVSVLKMLMGNPAAYHAYVFGEGKDPTDAMILGNIIHWLVLRPDEPLPYAVRYSGTLTTKAGVWAAINDLVLPDGVSPPPKTAREAQLAEWTERYAPDLYAQTKIGAKALNEAGIPGKTLVSQETMDTAVRAARKAAPVLAAFLAENAGDSYTISAESKIVQWTQFEVGGERLAVPFSMIADLVAEPDNLMGENDDKPIIIMDMKTFAGRHSNKPHQKRLQYEVWDGGIAAQLALYRRLMDLQERPVMLRALMVPVDSPENTAIVKINERWVENRGEAFLNAAVTKWWNCMKQFGGLDPQVPWCETDTLYDMDDEGVIFPAGQEVRE